MRPAVKLCDVDVYNRLCFRSDAQKSVWGSRQSHHQCLERVADNDAWGDTCLTRQRTHITPVITSYIDNANCGLHFQTQSHLEQHCSLWQALDDMSGSQGEECTDPRALPPAVKNLRARIWHCCLLPSIQTRISARLKVIKVSFLPFMVGRRWFRDACAVLLAALMLPAGLWPPRFS